MLSEPFYLFSQSSNIIPIIIDAYHKLKRDAMPIDKQSFTKCISLIARNMKYKTIQQDVIDKSVNFNEVFYKTSVESLIKFNTKTLANENHDFECKFNIWNAVYDIFSFNHA